MRTSLTIFLFLCALSTVYAQKLFVSGYIGGAGYQGELAPGVKPSLLKTSGGLGVEYEITNKLLARAWFSTGMIEGSDRKVSENNYRTRNLSFASGISEFSLGAQYQILDIYETRVTPYVFASVAFFAFNPYAYTEDNRKVLLQPLGTEGQGLSRYPDKKKYSLNQFSIPFGGGIRFAVSDNFRVGAEFGLRKTFTDYLDDVGGTYADGDRLLVARGIRAYQLSYRADEAPGGSPFYPAEGQIRGNPETKDFYYFMGLHASIRIGRGGGNGFMRGGRSRMGCPGNPM